MLSIPRMTLARVAGTMMPRRFLAVIAGVLLLVLGVTALSSLLDATPAGAAPVPSADSRTPVGEMNLAWSEPGMIGVVGWAKDPDVDRPIDVVVAIDRGMWVRTAGVYNPYLPGRYDQKFRSYLIAIPVSPGPHTMCVAALNVGRGNPFRLLGCKVFDNVASADPTGSMDGATLLPTGDQVRVGGWALDPETNAPLDVYLKVDGVHAGRVSASAARPDLAGFGVGTAHGYSADVGVTPGRHTICAEASNYNRGASATVGCRTIDVPVTNPSGNLERVLGVSGGMNVSGWAVDPNGAPVDIVIYDRVVGGVNDVVARRTTASDNRPDVAAITGLDPRAGFSVTYPMTEVGTHEFCVAAVNVGLGRDVSLGCRLVSVNDARPDARVESVTPTADGARIVGWVFDHVTARGVPQAYRLSVDGTVSNRTTTMVRNDVPEAQGSGLDAAGFDVTLTGLSTGRHTLCVSVVDQGDPFGSVGGDRVLPCSTVIVGSTAVGTSGAISTPAWVGPGGGSLAEMDRDGGVSVPLRDGSTLWLFGDSVDVNATGSLKYFVGGTAAWAAAGTPNVTRDAVTPAGAPHLLATPGEGFPACPAARPTKVMWPVSAFATPAGGSDRVVAFFANMCLANVMDYEFKGLSLAQWYYDPSSPPSYQPVQFTVINQNLALARPYGTASAYDPVHGWAYLYDCDRPDNPLDIGGYGPCRVARADPVHIGETALYTYWNGSTWVSNQASAVAMTMPQGALSSTRYPAAAFSVSWDPAQAVYVMVYSPWPGFVDRAMVRVARNPWGPWTEPVEVAFPGCQNIVDNQAKACYAATHQPGYSTSTQLGIGYYDQAVAAGRKRGQYMLARVPFEVDLS